MADKEQEIHISLTPKQIGVLVVILVGGFSAYPVVDMVNPGATSRLDPFTGTEGDELTERLDEHGDRLTIIELTIEQIIEDDGECENRQNVLRKDHQWLYNKVVTYQATTKERDSQQDRLIEKCMHRTQ